jgi:Lar family restriction alleviation protein
MSENIELKPCPFCNGMPHIHEAVGEAWVHCQDCGASSEMQDAIADAAEAWNRRAVDGQLAAMAAERDALKKSVQRVWLHISAIPDGKEYDAAMRRGMKYALELLGLPLSAPAVPSPRMMRCEHAGKCNMRCWCIVGDPHIEKESCKEGPCEYSPTGRARCVEVG